MTTQTIQSAVEPTNVVRLSDRRQMPADHSVGTIRLPDAPPLERAAPSAGQPTLRERLGRAATVTGAAWTWRHGSSIARLTALGVAVPVQRAWDYERAGEIGDQIRLAQDELRLCVDPKRRQQLDEEIVTLRERRHQVAHARHREHATLAGLGAGSAAVLALIVATVMVGLVVPAVSAGITGGAAYLAGRREQARRDSTVQLGGAAGGSGGGPGRPQLPTGGDDEGEEPDEQPALDGGTLAAAIKACGFTGEIEIIKAPPPAADGTSVTKFRLPPGVTVTALKRKDEELAGALGRDLSMIDITKEGAANVGSIWMSDCDPFEKTRPSPLLGRRSGIDSWAQGIPIGWTKRGEVVYLVMRNANTAIAGMTRSGKGVGAANLTAGAALDHQINLRIVAGKANGEWDPYARTGVAATYFKPNPTRLLALLNALLADMDRRNRILGELGKSKMTPDTIGRLGGIEVLVIDELATYTRSGSCPERDDILAALTKLSAVAAGAGILMVLITQYPEVDVLPQGLAMNCGTRWAMRVDNASQSNAILGGGASSSGRDASKFDPPRPGLGWLVNPFVGVTDMVRSFDLDEDERGEVTQICQRAAELREAAGRLPGQWEDPIERHLLSATGLSSAAGGPRHDGQPGRALATLTREQRDQLGALKGALAAMDRLGRDVARLAEMAELIGGGMTKERLGELLRAGGAGGTVKVTIPGLDGRPNGYQRADLVDALRFFEGQ